MFTEFVIFSHLMTLLCSPLVDADVTGFISDCPGSEKPSIITKENLNYLSITVLGAKSNTKRMYSYYQMEQFAKDPNMDYTKKTMIYVGGWIDSAASPVALVFQNVYRNLGYNIWLVDTSRFTIMVYPRAARLIRTVGKHVGEMLYNLTQHNVGFNPKKIEMLGISLGAQTMSYIAKTYKALSGTKIGRLTGLDPAGPCFRNLGPEQRLDKSDADFVDVVSTNIDGLGMPGPIGHVNFYVNGGEHQLNDMAWAYCDLLCSHLKVLQIWYSAVNNPHSFIAMQCDSVQQAREINCYERQPLVTNVLGLKVNKTKQGIFFLATTYYYPYHMGKKGLKRKYDPNRSAARNMNLDDVLIL
ncbi:lipase member H-like [Galleria mellonella]|uniref:Lipase member H-like n=1 Tax=Galleria mellonella TaxID=7137 RepID=A0ABM3N5N9_GALME|nr:lipase member H-like [Galleria mellonella]